MGEEKQLKEKKKTKSEFRKVLNEKGGENLKHKIMRGYGDYLYHQNRNEFNALFLKWKEEKLN